MLPEIERRDAEICRLSAENARLSAELDRSRKFWSDDADKRAVENRRLSAELADAKSKLYVPGRWRCPKCNFGLSQFKLRAFDGAIGVSDTPGEKCPNCDTPLWRVTEREAGDELADRCREYLQRATEAEAQLAAERGALMLLCEPSESMRRAAFGAVMFGGRAGPITADRIRQEATLHTISKIVDAALKESGLSRSALGTTKATPDAT